MPFKKVFRKARKAIKKIIPKEIRPFAPYIAAGFVPPGALGLGGLNPALSKAIIAGGTRFATDDEAGLKDIGITAALASTPEALKQFAGPTGPDTKGIMGSLRGVARKASESIAARPLTTIGAQGSIDAASKLAEIQQDEIDEYNRRLAEQGIKDKTQRRNAIRDIYLGVGYGEDYVDSMLDRFGYKGGGPTYTMDDILDMASEATKKRRKEREEEDEDELSEYIDIGSKGLMSLAPKQKPMPIRPLQMAEGGDVMSPEEYFTGKEKFMKQKQMEDMIREYERYRDSINMKRDRAAEGGMMNLGGNEMDLRGGGFVPIGKKEKADDVPARLSKNEFVMTADAVRGAGRGNINEGARRMYQTMNKLEAMA